MSGVLDMHTLLALQNGWSVYGNNFDAFSGLFVGVEEELLQDWFDELGEKKVRFQREAEVGTAKLPLVTVRLMGEQPHARALGDYGYTDEQGREIQEMLLDQQVRLTVWARNANLCSALFVVARGMLQLAKRAFGDIGYTELVYESGAELSRAEELVSEEAGVFMREQIWTGTAQVPFPVDPTQAPTQPVDWFVQLEGVEDDGDEGGVVPAE